MHYLLWNRNTDRHNLLVIKIIITINLFTFIRLSYKTYLNVVIYFSFICGAEWVYHLMKF